MLFTYEPVEELSSRELLDRQYLWLSTILRIKQLPVSRQVEEADRSFNKTDVQYASSIDKEVNRRQQMLAPLLNNPELEPSPKEIEFLVPFNDHVNRMKDISSQLVALATVPN